MSTGLLILCSPINYLQNRVGCLVAAAAKHVGKTLYVQLETGQTELWPLNCQQISQNSDFIKKCGNFIANFYNNCYNASKPLDVRFLLNNLKHPKVEKMVLSKKLDVILTDLPQPMAALEKYMALRFKNANLGAKLITVKLESDQKIALQTNGHLSSAINFQPWKMYDKSVLGGTFDRLHCGHKILLSEAILHTNKELTIGVTDGPMIRGKTLWELIEPYDVRVAILKDFLQDVDGSLDYKAEPIIDPFGPSIVDPELQSIIVSEETLKGGHKVNEERVKRGMNTLDVNCIELYPDEKRDSHEENKISSSSLRIRSLGARRSIPLIENTNLPQSPYIIGLTGGIASGKSSIAKRLFKLGAAIIDCDKLGHLSYEIGTAAYHQIIQHFGVGVVNIDKTINRRELGKMVFADKARLEELTSIVWPEIRKSVSKEIQKFANGGMPIIILEAAMLLEAGWQDMVHEVWLSIIPENEALKRITERDGIDEIQAQQRISRQMSNIERLASANVVLCTLWEPEFTQKQVETAWAELNNAMKLNKVHKL